MADDTEDVELDFAADEQERARRIAVIRCTAGHVFICHINHFVLRSPLLQLMNIKIKRDVSWVGDGFQPLINN